MNRRGRPILGAVAGILFFLSITLVLLTTGTIDLGSIFVLILPIVGLVVGVALGLMAPFGAVPAGPPGPPAPPAPPGPPGRPGPP